MEFKVGDKVRIIEGAEQDRWNARGIMKETIGMVGKIIEIDRYDPKYRVMFEDGVWWDYNEEDLKKESNMEFNWEEFISNDNIAVHCATEEQAKDFCMQMHEHGLKWSTKESYLKDIKWEKHKGKTCYTSYGTYSILKYYTGKNYTILEWSDYQKENSMNLELSNLTEEQKKQIIELAKKFEQENEVDKLDYENDYIAFNGSLDYPMRYKMTQCDSKIKDQLFDLGLTAHTKEDAEKIRRRLLVEKELRDWAKKCKEPVDFRNTDQEKHYIQYSLVTHRISIGNYCSFVFTNILFTDKRISEQAIESIGQERLIRDYFGIDI